MFAGSIRMEDTVINFTISDDSAFCICTVSDTLSELSETYQTDAKAFMIALSIAIHWDGTPVSWDDWKLAETAQPKNPELRFIP